MPGPHNDAVTQPSFATAARRGAPVVSLAIVALAMGACGAPERGELPAPVSSFSASQWSAREQANVEIMREFVQTLMNDHDFEAILEQGEDWPYVQHNPYLEDGISGLVKGMEAYVAQAPDFAYDVRQVFADGDIVIFHSHATLDVESRGDETRGFLITDKWRIDDQDRIVEHWDTIQPLDNTTRLLGFTQGERANDNGLF